MGEPFGGSIRGGLLERDEGEAFGQVGEGGIGKILPHVTVDGMDEFAHEAVSPVADLLAEQALGVTQGSFDGLEELQQRDLVGGQGKLEAAVRPARGGDDPHTDQLLHDFGQVVFRDTQGGGDLLVGDSLIGAASQKGGRMQGKGGRLRNANEISHGESSTELGDRANVE